MNRVTGITALLLVVTIICSYGIMVKMSDAEIRAKVAQVKSDLLTISAAIEEYKNEYGRAPFGMNEGMTLGFWPSEFRQWAMYRQLTTPIAYLTSIPRDPFRIAPYDYYDYKYNLGLPPLSKIVNQKYKILVDEGYEWHLCSPGPSSTVGIPFPWDMIAGTKPITNVYDPTNGSTSLGYIIRTNKGFFPLPQEPLAAGHWRRYR